MSNIRIVQIVAYDDEGGIGIGDRQLPWKLPSDLKQFRKLTDGHAVIMGRKTYESIGRPLPNREMIIISRQALEIDDCKVVNTFDDAVAVALDFADTYDQKKVFVIGGGEIYQATASITDEVYATEVFGAHGADRFYKLPEKMALKDCSEFMEENGERFQFKHYVRVDND